MLLTISEMSKFYREKIQNIDGQEKKLYYKGDSTWTTVLAERKDICSTLGTLKELDLLNLN